MSDEDYEYRGLIASSWDLLRGDTSGWEDGPFYLDLIRQYGQPVLDVGCATGRLLFDFLAQGIDTDGVDNSPEMLAICREKAARLDLHPNLYEQAMETMRLPRRYRTIVVSSSSFQLVTAAALARQALQNFYDHLLPGGALVMPFMLLWEPGDATERDWKMLAEEARPETDTVVRRWAKDWFDVENQLEHTENRYEIVRDGVVIASELHVRSPATRWYDQGQANALYQAAGFANVQILAGFTHEPATATEDIFSIVGQKA